MFPQFTQKGTEHHSPTRLMSSSGYRSGMALCNVCFDALDVQGQTHLCDLFPCRDSLLIVNSASLSTPDWERDSCRMRCCPWPERLRYSSSRQSITSKSMSNRRLSLLTNFPKRPALRAGRITLRPKFCLYLLPCWSLWIALQDRGDLAKPIPPFLLT